MSDIFISYAREDRPRAQQLAEAIANKGWEVWWDYSIAAGESFREVVEQKLGEAQVVIVLWSKSSVSSSFVLDEAARAQRRNVLAPVVIDGLDASEFPLGFGGLHAEDLSGWNGDERHEGFSKLNDLLTSKLGAGRRVDRESPSRPEGPVQQDAVKPSVPARASLELGIDVFKLMTVVYIAAIVVGAFTIVNVLISGQDWNLWLAISIPSASWGVLGAVFARRSLKLAGILAVAGVVLGLIIFRAAPG
jgi:hypothetical protein